MGVVVRPEEREPIASVAARTPITRLGSKMVRYASLYTHGNSDTLAISCRSVTAYLVMPHAIRPTPSRNHF